LEDFQGQEESKCSERLSNHVLGVGSDTCFGQGDIVTYGKAQLTISGNQKVPERSIKYIPRNHGCKAKAWSTFRSVIYGKSLYLIFEWPVNLAELHQPASCPNTFGSSLQGSFLPCAQCSAKDRH
jgi:hypothetical protein